MLKFEYLKTEFKDEKTGAIYCIARSVYSQSNHVQFLILQRLKGKGFDRLQYSYTFFINLIKEQKFTQL